MGSSVRGLGAGQPHLTHGVTAVAQGREAAENLRPAISVVAGVREVAEGLKPAISVVAGARGVRLVAAAEETNGRPVIAVRRAGTLPRAAPAVREVRGAAAAVGRAAEEIPLEVADVGEKE
jgi:hypothetical protein